MKKVIVTIRNGIFEPLGFKHGASDQILFRSGFIAQENSAFYRVVDSQDISQITNPAMGEWLPKKSARIACVIVA